MEKEVKDEKITEETEKAKEEIPESQEDAKAEDTAEEKPLDKMTAPELREIAKEIPGVTGTHAMKKDELLAIVKKARGIKDEEPPKKKKKKTIKPALSAKDLKLKMTRLRKEKEKAREAKDRKNVHILRRRINRLKKHTRKAAQA